MKKIMKTNLKFIIIALCFGFLFNTTSCIVIPKKESSKKGFIKSKSAPNNPRRNKKKGKSFKMDIKSNIQYDTYYSFSEFSQ
jgi:hypothetical protein